MDRYVGLDAHVGASPAPLSYRNHRSPVAGVGAGALLIYSLDNSFLRSGRSRREQQSLAGDPKCRAASR
jgi:hypothetical protein